MTTVCYGTWQLLCSWLSGTAGRLGANYRARCSDVWSCHYLQFRLTNLPSCMCVCVCLSVHTRILGHWIRCLLHPPREARHTNFTPCPRHGQMLTFLTPPRHHYDCCHHHHHHHYHNHVSLHHITSALNLLTDKQFRCKYCVSQGVYVCKDPALPRSKHTPSQL